MITVTTYDQKKGVARVEFYLGNPIHKTQENLDKYLENREPDEKYVFPDNKVTVTCPLCGEQLLLKDAAYNGSQEEYREIEVQQLDVAPDTDGDTYNWSALDFYCSKSHAVMDNVKEVL